MKPEDVASAIFTTTGVPDWLRDPGASTERNSPRGRAGPLTTIKTRRLCKGPLQGLRVIDLTRVLAGPFATQSLGDLGAEVLKIEPPGLGDETRHFPPFVAGESHYFLGINRNKKSLVIDLQQAAGADILRRLVAKADILVENYRPGVMDRLGLGYEALRLLNRRLMSEAENRANSDGLTELFNKRYLKTWLGEQIHKAEVGRYPVSVFVFDLDHFKRCNDTHGHLTGDRVLKETAKVLRKTVHKNTDVAARW